MCFSTPSFPNRTVAVQKNNPPLAPHQPQPANHEPKNAICTASITKRAVDQQKRAILFRDIAPARLLPCRTSHPNLGSRSSFSCPGRRTLARLAPEVYNSQPSPQQHFFPNL
jgi:hypothetical protein